MTDTHDDTTDASFAHTITSGHGKTTTHTRILKESASETNGDPDLDWIDPKGDPESPITLGQIGHGKTTTLVRILEELTRNPDRDPRWIDPKDDPDTDPTTRGAEP